MIHARFVDDFTIEVVAQDGEKFTWNTYFPVPKQNHQYLASRFEYYFRKHSEDNLDISLGYWIWIRMNYYEGLGIYGGTGDREEERTFISQERIRIGERIRELRKEKNIDAKKLAQIANIDAANLSRIEQGRYSVGLDILSKIALALGTKIELAGFAKPEES